MCCLLIKPAVGGMLCCWTAYCFTHPVDIFRSLNSSYRILRKYVVDSSWNVMAHGDAREGKWGGERRMEWVASTLHTTSEHGVSSITTADAHISAASSRLNWRPCRFKWIRPFRRKTKCGFRARAFTFQLATTLSWVLVAPNERCSCLICVFLQP